ncbi:hypothetical protein ACFOLD_09395 [Kocuria carniphila]|uniref:hypothetical protein n=1 Tax=Kocuria carniphila TaxID=262208 RepID=UPI0036220D31
MVESPVHISGVLCKTALEFMAPPSSDGVVAMWAAKHTTRLCRRSPVPALPIAGAPEDIRTGVR